jgi:cation:H+ antiporter
MVGWLEWLQFLGCLIVIGFSGSRLSRYGDMLAEKTGLGRTWMGLTGLAMVTSLPELVTSSTSILWLRAPDLAVGTIMGAVPILLLIMGLADLSYTPRPIFTAVARGHVLAGAFAIVMLALATMAIMAGTPISVIKFGHVEASSPILLLCYLLAMRATYRFQQRERASLGEEKKKELLYEDVPLYAALLKFGLYALVVILGSIWASLVAEKLARLMGWHQSVMGTFFLAAVATSPELVVTLVALRFRAVNLAIGNLMGSILVIVMMLGLLDFIYLPGPLLRAVSLGNASTGLIAILMMGVAVAELAYRPERKMLRYMSLGAFLLAILYASTLFIAIMYRLR